MIAAIAQYGNICLTNDALCETDRAQVLVSVPRERIRSVTLRNGIKVAHPILQILMGLVLVAIGGLPVVHVFRWATTGGTFVILEAAAAPLAFLGVWQIASAACPAISCSCSWTMLLKSWRLEVGVEGRRSKRSSRP